MQHAEKYTKQFFMPPQLLMQWAQKTHIERAPQWCSVDLRDGNQALIIPMSLGEKLEFFAKLVEIGFKEIEIGFPAASDTEYDFCRTLIEQDLIPDDVTIQVLTQSREHIIAKTFDALRGCKNAIVHLYNSTSKAQREQVFRKSKEEIIEVAIAGTKLCKEYAAKHEGCIRFEYSPESFTGTEPEFALAVCNAVLDVWQPTADCPAIINLPVTVELSMPHVYASQVAYICDNIRFRDAVTISLHPHNDRGCAVADTELGLLAGATRVEGTLFGNGERTGNADIITIAMNLYSQGVDPLLDFSDLPAITEFYSRVTRMGVPDRQPYSGKLVFAAFSGSHQDAIAKGMKWREEKDDPTWTVPYLPIDPTDVGRAYESDVIRINSQSGQGGIGYILETRYGYSLPKPMRERFGYEIKRISDRQHRELLPDEIYDVFRSRYVNITSPIDITAAHFVQRPDGIEAKIDILVNGKRFGATDCGNGRLDAVSNAVRSCLNIEYSLDKYTEHALAVGSTSDAVSYVELLDKEGCSFWGTGIDKDIIASSVKALVSAVNKMLASQKGDTEQ